MRPVAGGSPSPYANAGTTTIAAQISHGRRVLRLPTARDTHAPQTPFTNRSWTLLHAPAPRHGEPRRQMSSDP
jgi:hypothetical protein